MRSITSADAYRLINECSDVLLFDIRSCVAFESGAPMIVSAKNNVFNVPLKLSDGTLDELFMNNIKKISGNDMTTTILFMCYRGNSSKIACQLANDMQYVNVYNVIGGFQSWEEAKLPITKEN